MIAEIFTELAFIVTKPFVFFFECFSSLVLSYPIFWVLALIFVFCLVCSWLFRLIRSFEAKDNLSAPAVNDINQQKNNLVKDDLK